jgi:SAM-dependent methyltransferase
MNNKDRSVGEPSGWDVNTYMERGAKTRWGTYVSEFERRAILKASDLAGPPTTALDVGCEGGRWSKLLVDRGWRITAIDIGEYAISLCQKRIPSAKCILVDPDDVTLPCETKSQGLVLCIEVPTVIASDWFMEEAWRVLRPEGLLVGVFENKLSLRGYARHLIARVKNEYDYYNTIYGRWRKRLFRQGFKMIYEEGICWFPFSRTSDSPLVPVFTKLEQYLGLRRLVKVSPWIVFIAQKE